jgi:hypothetical protein
MRNKHEQTTTKIWKETLRKLRIIASLDGTSMVDVMDRLATAEIKRMGGDDGDKMRHLLHNV